ncbi:MAG: hypothetical protein ACK4I0_12260 [Brevundimonas sp.]|uniref:hypothetical protein n=1 Tax=Brevundimonas sp. TaxID=1871086 RepID=UPI00391AE599
MTRSVSPACRVQVYLADPRVAAALTRQARASRIPLSQAAGQAISRGLQRNTAESEDRLLRIERALRDHMRATGRDMQIVQELLIEVARAFFVRLPDDLVDEDPTVQAQVDRRVEKLLDAAASRIVAARRRTEGELSTANDETEARAG